MMMTGGGLVARALKAEAVTHLFTLCGGHIQEIYNGCLDEGIRVVDVRHEQAAVHAADGLSRVTGVPGVAAVTAGPGVTDAVTAVANAMRAQVPLILLGGQGARTYGPMGGQDRGALQEMNHVELMRPITKWAVSVPETRRLGEYVQSAFRVAMTGVPGPVFLEMPMDLLMGSVDEADAVQYADYRVRALPNGDPCYVYEAAKAIAESERPVLILGSQYRWSPLREIIVDFLEAAPMPVFLNGMARGALPAGHACGFKRCRTKAMATSDLVLVFGTPLDFRLGYGEKIPATTKIVQVDLDGSEIGRNRGVDVGIIGDSGLVLNDLRDLIGEHRGKLDFGAWLEEVDALESAMAAKTEADLASDDEPINPLRLCAEINRFVDDDTIVVGDGGDFVATASYILDVRGEGSWMDPGPLGTLGVGTGYAMAAKLAKPDKKVVLVMGDGTFGFNGMEFESMVRQGIPVVGIVGNDACWTQIHRLQVGLFGPERVVATELDYTRYDQVVAAFGGHGEYVERLADLRPALERAFAADRASLVNVKIGRSDFRKDAIAV